jgi:beta-galactosidase
MKTSLFLIILMILLHSCYFRNAESEQLMENKLIGITSLNQDWQFKANDVSHWTSTDLPHTPRIEPLIVNDQWQGKLIYKKVVNVEESHFGRTLLHFEGVMHKSIIFVNEIKIKEHVGGYLPFSVDLTDHLKEGNNEITIEVSNGDDSTIPPGKPLKGLDFNYYGGIYRDVWLIRKNNIHITDPFLENKKDAGWMIHFDKVTDASAKGALTAQIQNATDVEEELTIRVKLSDKKTVYSYERQVAVQGLNAQSINVPIEIESPLLWSTNAPNLYDLSIEVISQSGMIYEKIDEKIGIRRIELTNEGFFLNGKKQFIRGTNRHQEYPYVGYAISNNANYRDALKIKNAGFDFVRLSHYPQDKSFLDACDELGILVMNAIPGWQHYEDGEFVENSYQDIRDMVRRDRNHPSVIFWEVSLNESGMTAEYMKEANRILREELPFTDTYSAGWIDHPSYDLYIPARQHAKPPFYWNIYKNSKRPIFISEYGDWEYYAHNAGFNQSAFEDLSDQERNSRQLRSHGEKRLLQQALNFQEAANSNRRGIGTIGHSNWLMFDYNRGYADDLEASGIADIFRIPKFAYYFYKSQRPPNEKIAHDLVEQGPMVKIANYWTSESSTNIRVFSNCEEVALYLNDSLISRQYPLLNEFSDQLNHPPFQFNLGHFESGQLVAIGLISGKHVVKDSVATPGEPVELRLQMDQEICLSREINDIIFVYAEIVDAEGNMIHKSNMEVYFELIGEGELIGSNPIKAEAGIATILFKGDPGNIEIKASSGSLKSATLLKNGSAAKTVQ